MSERPATFEFGRVDDAVDPQSFVDYLDGVSRAVRQFKQLGDQALDVQAGDRVLDLGCGPGDETLRLAADVGGAGRVAGVDNSEAMVAEARRRAEGSGMPVEFFIGDAHRLDFADAEFDRVRAERVFQHLPDPEQALAELVRVTRPGGRIVVGPDPDWEALVIDSTDRELARRINTVHCGLVARGSIAHEIPAMMRALDLEDITVTPGTPVVTDMRAADLMLELSRVAERARDIGAISEDERSGWIAELWERDRTGRFFLALTGFLTSARKPPSAR